MMIFATAYVLTLIGCAPSSSSGPKAAPAPTTPAVTGDGSNNNNGQLVEVDPATMPECTADELNQLDSLSNSLEAADAAISAAAGQKDDMAVQLASEAKSKCEQEQQYHTVKPCKKLNRTVVNPDDTTLDEAYDAARIYKRCEVVVSYADQYGTSAGDDNPYEPGHTIQPAPGLNLKALSSMQQASSLIVKGANLLLDTSIISNIAITEGYTVNKTIGQCLLSNTSTSTVTYHGQKTVLTEASIYPDAKSANYQMFVLVTAEGVKLECYGLDYPAATASKNNVVRLLKNKNTNLNLSYELN